MIGSTLILLIKNMSATPDALPPQRNCAGILVHSPCFIESRISGVYQSVLPDAQKELHEWDDGQKKIHYYDGSYPGKCDTILSANTLLVNQGEFTDWDLYDLSEPNNDIGHGLGQDNLGLDQCNARIYTLLLKNWSDSTGDLVVGNADIDRWNGFLEADSTFRLPPNSVFALICEDAQGIGVGAGNALLRHTADGGNVQMGLNFNACSV